MSARETAGWRVPMLAAAFAIAIRLPFLGAGYGWDSDAWRMAGAAQAIAQSGHYVASRAPGYPLTELLDAALARLGPWGKSAWATNGLRALWAGLAAAAFVVLARRVGAPSPGWLAAAFTSVPAVFIAGTSTLDAMGSLAFGLTALALAASRRPWLAGIAAGVAAGMRPSSLLFALPTALFARGRERWIVLGTALVVFALSYAPALLAAGFATVGYYDLGYPGLALVAKKLTLDLWGPIGLLALAGACAWTLLRGSRERARVPFATEVDPHASLALWAGLVIFAALYLRLPYKALYLIPAVPFALLLFARRARPSALRIAIAGLVLAPWIGSIYEPGKYDDPPPSSFGGTTQVAGRSVRIEARGAVWLDRLRREQGLAHGARIVTASERLDAPAMIVAGDLLPMLRVLTGALSGPADVGTTRFVHHLTDADVAFARAERRAIYTAPGGLGSPSAPFGTDPNTLGARPLELDHGGQR